ncbi:MAG: phage Gp37/Gp68 family protein [Dehalococcoidia bacterium]
MGETTIAWTDRVWNPVTGCSPVNPACDHCYAKRMAPRLRGRFGYPQDDPFAVTLHPDKLHEPLELKKPQRIFVCSMGDLFHPKVPWEFISEVFNTMARYGNHHTYQILTKRPGRMAHFAEKIWPQYLPDIYTWNGRQVGHPSDGLWPSNVWAGVSIPNARYLPWLDVLARVPASVRFVSLEPLLGPVDITPWLQRGEPLRDHIIRTDHVAGPNGCTRCRWLPPYKSTNVLSWVIAGGESGPRARPSHPDWFRSVRDQCQEAGVPFFFKQWGEFIEVDGPHCRSIRTTEDGDCWIEEDGRLVDYRQGWGLHSVYRSPLVRRVGRRAAGAMLDGREHRELPNVQ